MKQFDYIIVGQGLAGTLLTYRLQNLGKRVLVVDKHSASTSSKVALGVYNPLVLKRFTPCWNIEQQLRPLYDFLDAFEAKFKTIIHESPKLFRLFNSVEEQNLWLEKSEKERLRPFMNPTFISNPYTSINAIFGFGEVNDSGRVNLPLMIQTFRDFLLQNSLVLNEDLEFSELNITPDVIQYKQYSASKIVFCEGHRLSLNPYFNYLPLMRTKGEILTVRIKNLHLKEHIKSSISILPLGDDLYKIGATFNWDQKDEIPTESAKTTLLTKLKSIVHLPIEVIKHEAGLRPTVKDRRALIGQHPAFKNLYVFNGLGARGLLLAPLLSSQLASYLEENTPLDAEVNITRYIEEYSC